MVRLNPNIPFKTRGNGAVVARLARREDMDGLETFTSGGVGNTHIESLRERSPEYDAETLSSMASLFGELRNLVSSESHLDDVNTNPGLVVSLDRFDVFQYRRAVREMYPMEKALSVLASKELTLHKGFGNGRGLVGCLGALAWLQNLDLHGMDRTFEIITYRRPEFWGTPREVDAGTAKELDALLPGTFNNYDTVNRKALVYPNSPCPVLFGVRGDDWRELPEVLKILDVSQMERWQLFVTNQGTDDHLVSKEMPGIEEYDSVITEGIVVREPWTIKGGHVFLVIEGAGARMLASAFEPTKDFRHTVRELRAGDSLRLYGGVKGSEALTTQEGGECRGGGERHEDLDGLASSGGVRSLCINIEKMEILGLTHAPRKLGNPICTGCRRRMKSAGAGQGYRCRRCGTTAGEDDAEYGPATRSLRLGAIYEVDGVARRHLSKPLRRMGK